jgi:hypothetical protein
METREYRTIDKSDWFEGPWKNEPDKLQWQDEATGLPCLIVRNGAGALCGYVGVTEGHPFFEKHYDEAKLPSGEYMDVHGGLTFTDFCDPRAGGEDHLICHVPAPGEPDHVWWLGFDCAHSGDLSPGLQHRLSEGLRIAMRDFETYKDIDYVKAECAKLAAQLGEVAQSGSAQGS